MVFEELGAIENREDYLDRALIEYSAASFHFEQGDHARYQACVENNLAMLFLKVNRFAESHEHLDRAQALFTRLSYKVHLAQVDETRARVMLAEGQIGKAAKFAKSAVQTLEKGSEPSLLAEALTTHGIVLTRLNDEENARAAFERAIAIAEQAGDLDSAGVAALTLFEQLADRLSDDDICEVLERAYDILKDSRNATIRSRLMGSAYRALSMIHTFRPDWNRFSLEQTLHRHEARYIRMALEAANGVISRAARLLGLRRHQNLHKILKTRHKNLRDVLTANVQDTNAEDTTRAVAEPTSHKIQTVRILYIQDDPTVAGLVREIAEHEGWELKQRATGNTALEELATDDEYDLLLVDHELPELSGLELIEHARGTFHHRYIPIVIMSGTLDEAAALEAGADAFLRKPEGIASLVKTITRLLDDRDQDA